MNPSIASNLPALRDIHLSPDPAFWPPAPGWWLITVLLLMLLIWLAVKARYLYYSHCQRRELSKEIEKLDLECGKQEDARFAAGLSGLLRRLALLRFPPDQVAALSGNDWLHFLDQHGGQQQFQNGPGQVLAEAPYAPDQTLDRVALTTLVTAWIRHNTKRMRHQRRERLI